MLNYKDLILENSSMIREEKTEKTQFGKWNKWPQSNK